MNSMEGQWNGTDGLLPSVIFFKKKNFYEKVKLFHQGYIVHLIYLPAVVLNIINKINSSSVERM